MGAAANNGLQINSSMRHFHTHYFCISNIYHWMIFQQHMKTISLQNVCSNTQLDPLVCRRGDNALDQYLRQEMFIMDKGTRVKKPASHVIPKLGRK